MLTLYSYPSLYAVTDNNPYGLKIYRVPEAVQDRLPQEHVIDVKDAPRGQLPYIADSDTKIGDSDLIIAYLIERHALSIDRGLTAAQRGHGSSRPKGARRPVLGDVVLALEGRPVLAAVPRRAARNPSGHQPGDVGSG
ncbi:MAG: glutathione S-transferase N-terminal domain-containing protein [Acetobacteraceae bacterium]